MTYKAGIIGTGGIAGMGILGMHSKDEIGEKKVRASHAGGYREAEGIELVAAADPDEEKLTTFGDAWDISPERRYSDHESMLASEDLDVVSVCTPTFLHHQHVIDAAESPADPDLVWCEKPLASSIQDGREMIEVCDDTDTELLINHSFRFTEKIQKLRELLEDDIIGDVKSINAQFRRELLRNSSHVLDTIIYLLDSRPERISGYINGENDAVESLGGEASVDDAGGGGTVVMADGTFTSIDCTVARDISSMSLDLIGTEGKIYLNNDDSEWRYWELTEDGHVESELPGIDRAWSWESDYADAFPNAANHIVDLLSGDAESISSGRDAMLSLEIIIGFYVSHYTGSHVEMPLDRPLEQVAITSW